MPRSTLMGLAALGLTAGACRYWDVWDEVFNRASTTRSGWMTSDGGFTIVLPGNRLLWTFDDTIINPFTITPGQEWEPDAKVVFGNTIGVHPIQSPQETPPDPANAQFWARTSAGLATNITYTGTEQNTEYFRNATCSGASPNDLLWPGDGVVINGTLFQMTWLLDANRKNVRNVIQKFSGITTTNSPANWVCTQLGVEQPPPLADPATEDEVYWGVSVLRDQPDFNYIFGARWQGADIDDTANVIQEMVLARAKDADIFDSTKWIFLYKPNYEIENGDGTSGKCLVSPCYLGNGHATQGSVTNGYPDTEDKRDHLSTVARNVGPEFSVDKVTHTETGTYGSVSGTRYVMVHGRPGSEFLDGNGDPVSFQNLPSWIQDGAFENVRELSMRSTDHLFHWPGTNSGAQAQSGYSGSTARGDIIGQELTWPGLGTVGPLDADVVSGWNAFRAIHGLKGHGEISEAGNITVTYAVWAHWTCADGTCDNWNDDTTHALAYTFLDSINHNYLSAFRFTKIPLRLVEPWCQAHFSGACQYGP